MKYIIPLLFLSISLSGQSSEVQVTFQKIPLPLILTKSSVTGIIDNRKSADKSSKIIIRSDNEKRPLFLQKNYLTAIKSFFSKNPENADTDYNIILKINDFNIREIPESPAKIKGNLGVDIDFQILRDSAYVPLCNFKTNFIYSRPCKDDTEHIDWLVKNAMLSATKFYNKWFGIQKYINPKFAKGVRVLVKPDYYFGNDTDTVFYHPDRKLTWNDFQAKPLSTSRYTAQIFSNFEYLAPVKYEHDSLVIELTMKTYMLKDMSWKSIDAPGDYSLKHEQTHFDLTKLIVERFKAQVLKTEFSIEDYDSQLQLLFIDLYREMNIMQKKYDQETLHGLNEAEQSKWEQKIAGELGQKN